MGIAEKEYSVAVGGGKMGAVWRERGRWDGDRASQRGNCVRVFKSKPWRRFWILERAMRPVVFCSWDGNAYLDGIDLAIGKDRH